MKTYNTNGALITSNEGNLRSYDTGWVACSTWTNQHLGSALGGNVVHNLNAPLRNLVIKVFWSSDGTDANSYVLGTEVWSHSAGTYHYNFTVRQVDADNIVVQTGSSGLLYINDSGTGISLTTESDYYRIVVYEMTSVYSGVHMEMYETPWIACADWTDQHLGTTLGNNLVHNLNTPLSDLLVKVLYSTSGTDVNSYEVENILRTYSNGVIDYWYGAVVSEVDADSLIVQTGAQGIRTLDGNGVGSGVSGYYKIKVYKLTAQPPAIV
ncbi:hypothetical protein LCGC14_3070100, partial [marine sediment metagenome]